MPRLVALHAGAIQIAKARPKLLEDYTESFKLDVPGLLALSESGLHAKYREVMSPQTQIASNQGFQAGWKFPTHITQPQVRRKVTLELPADERYQKLAGTPAIIIEPLSDRLEAASTDGRLPFYSLAIGASGFRHGDEPDPQGWVNVRKHGCTKRLGNGFFVTQVLGRSMEPTIRDGAYCVFRAGVSGTRQNRVLLVQKRDYTDPETGGGYTVKRYQSTKSTTQDGWKHKQIRLVPDSPDRTRFPVLEFSPEDDAELRVVAEFVQMLEPPASSAP